MFKTIKLPIIITDEDKVFIEDLQRQYSLVVRCAYNRLLDGNTEKEIRLLVKSLNSIHNLNSWLVQCAILDAKSIFIRNNVNKDKTINPKQIFFGGKNLLKRFHRKLITKEEFKYKRLRPIDIQGECLNNGNRMFNINISTDNSLTFKVNRNKHIKINLPKLRNNHLNQLLKLECLTEQKEVTYSIKLTANFIYINYNLEELIEIKHLDNRCLGIDMNPNFVGVSILEFKQDDSFKVLTTKMYDIKELTKRSGKSSYHKDSIYLHNKLQFETIEITKSILNLAKAFNVKFVYLEDLKFKQGDSEKGKGFNRLTKNKWLKTLFQEQLKKRLDLFGFKWFNVNPVYTSVIGNLQHDYLDPINASIEMARRGQEVIIIKNKKFYPEVWVKDTIKELWKQTNLYSPKEWKELFTWLKNSKLKYRVSLYDCKQSYKVFSKDSIKSKVLLYDFG